MRPGIVTYLSDVRLLHTLECGEKQCRLVHVFTDCSFYLMDGRISCSSFVMLMYLPRNFSVVKLICWPLCENPRTAVCSRFLRLYRKVLFAQVILVYFSRRLHSSRSLWSFLKLRINVNVVTTGWMVQGYVPGVGKKLPLLLTPPDRPWGWSSQLYNVYRVFSFGKSGRSVELTTQSLLWACMACFC
jgi:hypothetical protein